MNARFLPQQLRAACSHAGSARVPREWQRKQKSYTNRVSATAEDEAVTAAGLRDAVLKLIQNSLVTQVRL